MDDIEKKRKRLRLLELKAKAAAASEQPAAPSDPRDVVVQPGYTPENDGIGGDLGSFGTSVAMGALNAGSQVGIPNVLAGLDVIQGKKIVKNEPDLGWREKFQKHQEFYNKGLRDMYDKETTGSLIGTLLAAVAARKAPGGSLKNVAPMAQVGAGLFQAGGNAAIANEGFGKLIGEGDVNTASVDGLWGIGGAAALQGGVYGASAAAQSLGPKIAALKGMAVKPFQGAAKDLARRSGIRYLGPSEESVAQLVANEELAKTVGPDATKKTFSGVADELLENVDTKQSKLKALAQLAKNEDNVGKQIGQVGNEIDTAIDSLPKTVIERPPVRIEQDYVMEPLTAQRVSTPIPPVRAQPHLRAERGSPDSFGELDFVDDVYGTSSSSKLPAREIGDDGLHMAPDQGDSFLIAQPDKVEFDKVIRPPTRIKNEFDLPQPPSVYEGDGVMPGKVADRIETEILPNFRPDGESSSLKEAKNAEEYFKGIIKDLRDRGQKPYSFSGSRDEIGLIDEMKGNFQSAEKTAGEKSANQLRGIWNSESDELAKRTLSESAMSKYAALQDRYGNIKTLRELGKSGMSSGKEALRGDNAKEAAKASIINRLATRGAGYVAAGANAVSKYNPTQAEIVKAVILDPNSTAIFGPRASNALRNAMEKGDKELNAVIFTLGQSDPQFQEAMKKAREAK
jgi:hypothetical protein